MEMTLNLTFEEGLKVAEAMKNIAIENGWDAEELYDCGVIEEYSRVIDAALTAMGVNISIAGEPEVKDDDFDNEEWDEDEEDSYFNLDDDEEDDEELLSDEEVFQMIKQLFGGL